MTSAPGNGRLLAGWAKTGRGEDLGAHLARLGPLPSLRGAARGRLLEEVTSSGLVGRGGAGFPTGRKLASVASAPGRPVVVGNACEGDPASSKGQVLAEMAPHLVLDGLQVAAAILSTDRIHLCAHRGSPTYRALEQALAGRTDEVAVHLAGVPGRFVASEESALVNLLNGREGRPTGRLTRVFERGVGGRPTYVGNIETLAHIALIARYGAAWFRAVGTKGSPGTVLVTLDGAVHRPGVVEVPYGTTLGDLLEIAGGSTEPVQAVLVGGCSGSWIPWSGPEVRLTHGDLRARGATVGVGSLAWLPERSCGLAQTAHLVHYLAGESARQCGPCMFGLPAIATGLAALASGATDRATAARLERHLSVVSGRGACAHPDGVTRLAASALRTFEGDVRAHLGGRPCHGAGSRPFLPLPAHDLVRAG